MPRRTTYLNYIRPLSVGILLLAGWLSMRLWQAQGREQAMFRLVVSAPTGSISEELPAQTDGLPGCVARRALYCADAEIQIDRYSASVELWGAELSEYPLTVVRSTGEKRAGSKPLLIVGQDFFEGFSDEYGNPISERQANILKEQAGTSAIQIAVKATGRAKEGTSADDGEKKLFQNAELLGIVEEEGVYMDADQMRRWFAQMGLSCEIGRMELEIRGEQNARRAQEALEKAGYQASALYRGM